MVLALIPPVTGDRNNLDLFSRWLRQEENQFLDVPPEVAKKLPPQLAQLIGYKTYDSLGFSINPEYPLEQDS